MHRILQRLEYQGLIYEEPEGHFQVDVGRGNDCELYRQVIGIRAANPVGPYEYEFDRYSEHYLIRHHGRPIGALTATRMTQGELDCVRYYPQHLLVKHGHELFSIYKFRMLRSDCSPLSAVRAMGRAMWIHQLSLGSRVLVINSAKELLPFYVRMGFRILDGSEFVHPSLGTESLVLVQLPDPDWKSFYQDIFSRISDPLRWSHFGPPQMLPSTSSASASALQLN